ncbi:hypothetical protein [Streptomyces sp. Isolate_45]|uniref:hypothetical protein n=1 Tax=Streptomyces sp. Isolate_45 TaxID=2950111 RepID=UPI00248209A2|nr:hypothetical protein [Streptomyces sp. Isolate_45]MDA5284633.1 hypothetical protein [Streptomyces sp. Isolate_45]
MSDIATRVTQGVQALAADHLRRDMWQAQHRAGLLTDAQTYEALADAIEADLKGRGVDGDLPWSAGMRARKRVKPLRKAARAMREAAAAIGGTVTAYETTDPATIAQARQDKALRKAERKGAAAAALNTATARAVERLAPAQSDEEAGAPQVLGDYFKSQRRA